MLKLTVSISEEKKRYRYRRWAKSTLLLVPLFGVHYALLIGMSSSMNKNQYVEMVWLFCEQLFASFQ
uniref:G-protein coupled receptors family 2 profile 2 domain-containing protein n=3 Tax=Rhodnius prolixus TaxID=13249 RepID=T1I467_RHOPR